MNEWMDKLIALLEEETLILKALFVILEEEAAALTVSDLNKLHEVHKKKENEVLKIRLLEEQREKIVKRIAVAMGLPQKGMTISGIAERAGHFHAETLIRISEKMQQFTYSIRILNQKNKNRIEQSLGLVRDSLALLENLISPAAVYHHNGRFNHPGLHSGRLLCSTI